MNKKWMVLLPQLIVSLCLLAFSPSYGQETVTLTVEDGIGIPGSYGKTLDISLINSVTVTLVEMYVCDEGDHLNTTPPGCQITGRTAGSCDSWEVNDCSYVTFAGTIGPGDGPIFTLTYNVHYQAPAGECKPLTIDSENLTVTPTPDVVILEDGQFCFKCTTNEDCANPNFCWDEFCNPGGICNSSPHCLDDGIYCNGNLSYCDEVEDLCKQTGNPCSPLFCDEGDDSCYCTNNDQCNEFDGRYCNGEESCEGGVCKDGVDPCAEPTPVCDEDSVQCFPDDVTITVGNWSDYPGGQDNPVDVELYNPDDKIISIEFDICGDEGNQLTCPYQACELTGRCIGWECNAGEMDGCCHVSALMHPFYGYPINQGDGRILTIYYDVSEEIPPGCIDLNPENIVVVNDNIPPDELWALPVAGEFCDQCRGDFECDGDVDGTNAFNFKGDFGRGPFFNPCTNENPCNGDFECDGDVDGTDAFKFKADFGRWDCAPCPGGDYCIYE